MSFKKHSIQPEYTILANLGRGWEIWGDTDDRIECCRMIHNLMKNKAPVILKINQQVFANADDIARAL